jgi:hypothetical protein
VIYVVVLHVNRAILLTAEDDRVSALVESYAEYPDGRIYNDLPDAEENA